MKYKCLFVLLLFIVFMDAGELPPTAAITSPTAGGNSPYVLGDTIAIDITAFDSDGFVTNVEVINGSALLGTATRTSNDSFRLNYTVDKVGFIDLQARVTDNSGNTNVSTIETIAVITGAIPVVAIDELNSVMDGDSITAGYTVQVLVHASDDDGFITQVNIYDGSSLLGQAYPTGVAGQYDYDLSINNADAGIIRLVARATDERGNEVSSSVVSLTVIPRNPDETLDSDGDGIVDSDDAFPNLPTQDVVSAIRSNPTIYNIYSIDDIKDLRAGSTMIAVENGEATLSMEVEQSSDLGVWNLLDLGNEHGDEHGDEGDEHEDHSNQNLSVTIPVEDSTRFFRFKMAD